MGETSRGGDIFQGYDAERPKRMEELGEAAKGLPTEELQKEFDEMLAYETDLKKNDKEKYDALTDDKEFMDKKMAYHLELQERKKEK